MRTRPEQRANARAKLLPVQDDRTKMDKPGSTPLQEEWSKLMLGNHSVRTPALRVTPSVILNFLEYWRHQRGTFFRLVLVFKFATI